MEKYEMVATTLMGLEQTLADEITALGGERVKVLKRAVSFAGDDTLLYTCNLALRSALRVLVPLAEFTAGNEDQLYNRIKDFPWEDIFSPEQTFVIDPVVSGTVFRHSHYVALKSKDAIADRFRARYGRRPGVDTRDPDIYLHLRVHESRVTVSIDSSGVSLDKRGYRKVANEAPLNEVLAAGILLLSGWTPAQPLVDPMAGSGTFGIEAALIGTRTPPGMHRTFAFQRWNEYDANLFEKVRYGLSRKIRDTGLKIYSRDILGRNMDIISQNAEKAGMDEYLSIRKEDFFESSPKEPGGVVVINPPYGERLQMTDIELFYKRMGDTLKQRYEGYDAWIISSDLEALKAIGLKAGFKTDLMNGGLPARLVKYSMYKGSREES
ncbi:class I SAM-dependent RNA methyltransferase [Leadbetterella sp. DM7]|uniref:THUMP domain-containing class I SAM-dependent RNA methyltransferase n=1 Tax=Leadbetterella sp. DM7 TaxID=3235085 RepID=UPI00349EE336